MITAEGEKKHVCVKNGASFIQKCINQHYFDETSRFDDNIQSHFENMIKLTHQW